MEEIDQDERVAPGSKNVENFHDEPTNDDDKTLEREDEKSFLLPSRWWFASTAAPLTAGTFGPMANAFSICALVENWRTEVPPGGTEGHGIDIKDPQWYRKTLSGSVSLLTVAG